MRWIRPLVSSSIAGSRNGLLGRRACSSGGAGMGGGRARLFLAGAATGAGGAAAACLWVFGGAEPSNIISAAPPYSCERVLYVMRGLSGCGKSTVAREKLQKHLSECGVTGNVTDLAPLTRAFILSTDDFFGAIDEETGEEKYVFNVKKLGVNHGRNHLRCSIAMELGITPLFVDNTNTQFWEMRSYVEAAKENGYRVEVIDVMAQQGDSVTLDVLKERCAKRDIAGKDIPDAALERMWKRYERLPADPEEAEKLILKAEPPFRRKEDEAAKAKE
eukprot:TRINITY_DN5459_c0_g1_i1.p1 TRINITY_DN5459_c0_g1~~TRINITY_DN5459_c0_g1_i1.p1  ORF type:complete len:275 (+),score=61.54 TRINITY_DN5459_c0_g1_i1:191-1015(+)